MKYDCLLYMSKWKPFIVLMIFSCFTKSFSLTQVMNDVVVDRGPSPYLTNLELFCNGRIMTSVQGDGNYQIYTK